MCKTRVMRNVLMLLLCAAAFAQQQPGTLDPAKDPVKVAERDKADKDVATFTTGTNIVIAPTTVLDKHGDYVNGLQLQDFQLFDNNKVQKITADVHDQPLSLVVAVQKSSNLNEILPKIQRIGSMLNDLIAGADGETAVVAFDHRFVVAQDFTNETGKITETMKKLTPGSSQHAVDDAVMKSIRMLRNRPKDRRKVLLLISERRDQGSEMRVREVLTEAEFANVVIYSLDISSVMAGLTSKGMPPPPPSIPAAAQHMPAGVDATPTLVEQNYYVGNYIPMFVDIFKAAKSIFVEEPVVVFTRFTGGKEYPFVTEKSLERAIQGISQELHSQYLLSYTPNNQTEGGFHEIRVTVNRPQLEIRTRPGYWVAARPDQ
jgi:VWFA-related protein